MLAPSECAPHRPSPLPSALLAAELGPAVMADDPSEAAFSAADPTGPRKYYRARYYEPKIGRFLSEDPIGIEGGENFYAYVENNPVTSTDPSGMIVWRVNEERRQAGGVLPGGNTGIARPRVLPVCTESCGQWDLRFYVFATITQTVASGSGPWARFSQAHEDWHRQIQRENLVQWVAPLRPYEHVYNSKAECEAAAASAMGQLGKWDPVQNNMDISTRIMRRVHGID